jgi:hypothetical protein
MKSRSHATVSAPKTGSSALRMGSPDSIICAPALNGSLPTPTNVCETSLPSVPLGHRGFPWIEIRTLNRQTFMDCPDCGNSRSA